MPPPWMDLPVKNKELKFVLQYHDRGKSRHSDIRFEVNDHLVGYTLDDPAYVGDVPSMSNKPGMNDKKILCQSKARQPKDWLTFKGTIAPGGVGATKYLPARFTIVDKGTYEMGAQKAHLFEVFLHGRKYTDRFIFRLLPLKEGRKALNWLMWKPEDQAPYVFSLRAKNEGWVPPKGYSALPKKWQNLIPKDMRWWEKNWTGNKAREVINEVRKMFLKRDILSDQKKKRDFVLQRHWWKGQRVVRDVPVEHWDLRMGVNFPYFNLNANPIVQKTGISGIKKTLTDERYMKFEGRIPPNPEAPAWLKPANPNKTIPAFIEILDKGKVDVIEHTERFMSFKFYGKKLKGFWTAKSADGIQVTFEKSALPGEKRLTKNISLSDSQIEEIKKLFNTDEYSYQEIADIVKCSRTSVYNAIHYDG